jgi:1-acyl-sn-glycerol-3-phosphate acyltransferase
VSNSADFFERYRDDKDEYGFNIQSCKSSEGFFRFLYKNWFEVTIVGLENIPAEGRAVLYGNHSGVLPLDGVMLYDGIIQHHPSPRRIRFLVNEFIRKSPGAGDIIRGFGGVPAKYDVALDLLNDEELVFFYPEAEKGTGKLYKDRYNLVDFNPGFIKAALETESKLVPVVTVGGDEIYPLLGNLKPVAKVMGAPYWPITPFFPWLPFPLCAVPLPVKMLICIGKPFDLEIPKDKAEDHALLESEAKKLRQNIQTSLDDLLLLRTSPYKKWDVDKVTEYWQHQL